MPKIKFYRGLKANLPILDEATPAFTTDTEEFFIGSKDGNIKFSNRDELLAELASVNVDAELIAARGTYPTLGPRLDNVDSQFTGITTKNAQQFQNNITTQHLKYFAPIFWTQEAWATGQFDWNSSTFKTKVDYYYNLGMRMITLQPVCFISDTTFDRRYTNLESGIQYVQSKGMKVGLRLHIFNGNSGKTKTTTLGQQLQSYENEMATIAQNYNIDIFFMGCEIGNDFDLYNVSLMTNIVNSIRGIYKGLVSYGGTHGEAGQITWWGLLDFIGVDFYPTTTNSVYSGINDLFNGYFTQPYDTATSGYDFLNNLYTTYNKPIYLTEWNIVYGTTSNGGLNINGNSAYSLDMQQMQANGMEAMMRFQSDTPFIVGSNIWCELVDDSSGTWDDGKFIGRAKSENVVTYWSGLIG